MVKNLFSAQCMIKRNHFLIQIRVLLKTCQYQIFCQLAELDVIIQLNKTHLISSFVMTSRLYINLPWNIDRSINSKG